ncbi:hypothetical protein [Streptomyces caeruleatus]|uniref:Uncharacterized protein n=1 Tax=Streptomyces caeruleatus TaxID=661399 RepID=A0A101U294_9ACTN|nr:hypothetical protein [Streptomyces caeruleatus]KUO02776.1 hypothetical protein AQJ67_20290 [Streptomyces caeruleatus]
MTAGPRPVRSGRLEPGEGVRRTGSGVALVDILTGRLLSVPDAPGVPLRTVHPGVDVPGTATPACRLDATRHSAPVGAPA